MTQDSYTRPIHRGGGGGCSPPQDPEKGKPVLGKEHPAKSAATKNRFWAVLRSPAKSFTLDETLASRKPKEPDCWACHQQPVGIIAFPKDELRELAPPKLQVSRPRAWSDTCLDQPQARKLEGQGGGRCRCFSPKQLHCRAHWGDPRGKLGVPVASNKNATFEAAKGEAEDPLEYPVV